MIDDGNREKKGKEIRNRKTEEEPCLFRPSRMYRYRSSVMCRKREIQKRDVSRKERRYLRVWGRSVMPAYKKADQNKRSSGLVVELRWSFCPGTAVQEVYIESVPDKKNKELQNRKKRENLNFERFTGAPKREVLRGCWLSRTCRRWFRWGGEI